MGGLTVLRHSLWIEAAAAIEQYNQIVEEGFKRHPIAPLPELPPGLKLLPNGKMRITLPTAAAPADKGGPPER